MNYTEFLAKWKDLIFTPLDLETPFPLSSDQLLEYTKLYPGHAHEAMIHKTLYNKVRPDFDYTANDPNDFEFFASYRIINRGEIYDKIFCEKYPQVFEWFDTLPMPPGKKFTFGWITQLEEDVIKLSNKNMCSALHVDECMGFGLRLFFNNKDNNLFYYGVKPEYNVQTIKENKDPYHNVGAFHSSDYSLNEKFQVPNANECFFENPIQINVGCETGFGMVQARAVHVIKKESHSDKITMIIEPVGDIKDHWDWEKVDRLLEHSVNKYPEQSIWYEDFLC